MGWRLPQAAVAAIMIVAVPAVTRAEDVGAIVAALKDTASECRYFKQRCALLREAHRQAVQLEPEYNQALKDMMTFRNMPGEHLEENMQRRNTVNARGVSLEERLNELRRVRARARSDAFTIREVTVWMPRWSASACQRTGLLRASW